MQILFFSVLAAAATVIGGAIPLTRKRVDEVHLTLLIAFSGGVLLSTGLNHMIVESYAEAGRWAMLAVSFGFLSLYGYEKVAMIHACREFDCKVHDFGRAALSGIGFHSFLDGFAIAVSYEFDKTLGLLVMVAVLLHRLPTGFSTACIMLAHDYSRRKAWRFLSLIAALAVAGGMAGILLAMQGISGKSLLGIAVGLSGGTFLYISTSDLLPLAHENSRDYRVPLFFFVGFLGILATSFITF